MKKGLEGLARQAVLLGEADLLPSVGLTVYYGEMTQANLARGRFVSISAPGR